MSLQAESDMFASTSQTRSGFTLIELLVVIATLSPPPHGQPDRMGLPIPPAGEKP